MYFPTHNSSVIFLSLKKATRSPIWLGQGSLTEAKWISTVDLLILTSLEPTAVVKENIIYFFYETRRSTVLSLPLQLVFTDS
jgi:hypothetical protein